MSGKRALLIVDVQNDFCPGGALAVKGGDTVVPVLNRYAQTFAGRGDPIFASRDWHPEKTAHFKEYGGPWPVHCLQNTKGAEFHPGLQLPGGTVILSKGDGYDADSYSAFHGKNPGGKPLLDILKAGSIQELFIGGLATDYCVKNSVLDAVQCGFTTYLLTDAVKGVDMQPGDSQKALKEMKEQGAIPMTFSKFTSIQ